jgi:hypothetical protein
MLDVLVVVSTCPRPGGVVYLPGTLSSLDAAGARFFTRVVFSDGRLPVGVACAWPYIETENAVRSPRNNLQAAIRMADEVGAERLLFFEDDVVACKNAVLAMAALEFPRDAAFVSFHDIKETRDGRRPELLQVPVRGFDGRGLWGSQALAFPRRAIRQLRDKDFFSVRQDDLRVGSDRSLEDLTLPFSPSYRLHVPSLVNHVGRASAAHPETPPQKRETRNYLGDDFDAACLMRAEAARRRDLLLVMTSPRQGGVSYLDETLKRLDLEGANHPDVQKILFSDGPLPHGWTKPRTTSPSNWEVREYEGPSGAKEAIWRIFRYAANRKFDRLISFEDDVVPCRNAVTKVFGTDVPPGAAFMSYFDYRSCGPERPDGIYLLTEGSTKGGRYWGTQAICFPREVVCFLAEQDPKNIPAGGNDTAVWDVLRKSPWHHVALHVPSLFDHVGEVSTQPNPVMHRALRPLPESSDALLLPIYDTYTRLE